MLACGIAGAGGDLRRRPAMAGAIRTPAGGPRSKTAGRSCNCTRISPRIAGGPTQWRRPIGGSRRSGDIWTAAPVKAAGSRTDRRARASSRGDPEAADPPCLPDDVDGIANRLLFHQPVPSFRLRAVQRVVRAADDLFDGAVRPRRDRQSDTDSQADRPIAAKAPGWRRPGPPAAPPDARHRRARCPAAGPRTPSRTYAPPARSALCGSLTRRPDAAARRPRPRGQTGR